MAKLKLYDAFETKAQARNCAKDMRTYKVQWVRVRKISSGRLKWGVYLGGKNSRAYV